MRQVLLSALTSHAKVDPSIFLVVGDLGYGVVEEFATKFPLQFVNAGVAEQNMTGMAAGLALKGKKVFTYSIANFPTLRALEQVRNDILYHNLPVTIVSVGTGFGYGPLGYSHHAIEDVSVMRALPGLRVLSPSTDDEVREALELILSNPKPTYLRLAKSGYKQSEGFDASTGSPANRGKKDGRLVLTMGSILGPTLDALGRMGDPERSMFTIRPTWKIKPLELPPLDLNQFSRIFTIEEHSLEGGFGSAVLEHLERSPHIQKVIRIGIPEGLNHLVGSEAFLRENCGLDSTSLLDRLRE